MSLIVKGYAHDVPGREGSNFRRTQRLKLASRSDWRRRRVDEIVTCVVIHTRLGLPVKLREGKGPNKGWDLDLAARFSKDTTRNASCHIGVDADGSYGCFADLATDATYHASHLNGISVGVEMYQEADGTVYSDTLESCADICDVLTRVFGIQRQVPKEIAICRRFANIVPSDPMTYIALANRGRDYSGVLGHRNLTRNRGPGDPGDPIFGVLMARGYECFAVDESEDVHAWEHRQRALGFDERDIDGVPERVTRSLIAASRKGGPGIWVIRPGDDLADGVA